MRLVSALFAVLSFCPWVFIIIGLVRRPKFVRECTGRRIGTWGEKMNTKITSVWILAASMLIGGCESMPFQGDADPPVKLLSDSEKGSYTPPAEPVMGIPASSHKRFNEIPLPDNLREDTQRTFVYDSRTVKIGKMVYYSKNSVNELAQFYITNAPLDNWTLVSTTQSDDSVLLFFVKPGKRLNVESIRGGVGRSNELILNYLPAEDPAQ